MHVGKAEQVVGTALELGLVALAVDSLAAIVFEGLRPSAAASTTGIGIGCASCGIVFALLINLLSSMIADHFDVLALNLMIESSTDFCP